MWFLHFILNPILFNIYVLSKHIYLMGSFVLRSFLMKWPPSVGRAACAVCPRIPHGDVGTFSCEKRQRGWVWGGEGEQNKPQNSQAPEMCGVGVFAVRQGLVRRLVGALQESRRWNAGGSRVSQSVTSPASSLNWSWGGKKTQ